MVRRLGSRPQKLTVHKPCPVPRPMVYAVGVRVEQEDSYHVANGVQYQTSPLLQILRVYVGHER